MWLFDRIKRKRAEPLQRFDDDVLGSMIWQIESEAWEGVSNNLRFSLAYDGGATPNAQLIEYGRNMLLVNDAIIKGIEQAKGAAIINEPNLKTEIGALRVGVIHFFIHKGVRRILADLESDQLDRSWRAEFKEDLCEGIGYDT